MNIDAVIAFLKKHKGAIISLGAIPAAIFTIRNLSGLKRQEKGSADVSTGKNKPAESKSARRRMTSARKNRIISDIRRELLTLIPKEYIISFGKSEKQGYRGYYVRKNDNDWLFLCWSDVLEDAYESSTFWVELSESVTGNFKERNLKLGYDIYTHPAHPGRIAISIPDEDVNDIRNVAEEVGTLMKEVF